MAVTLTSITTGNLTVTSTPSAANLYVDGTYRGLTPLTVLGLSLGNHIVNVTKSGYYDNVSTKSISAGSNSMAVTLTSITTGNLTVTSTPSAANLYVDSVYRGLTPLTVLGLSLGNHNIRVTKSGYYDNVSTKSISAGSNSMAVTLVPLPITNGTNLTG
jgi:hypothetical protein